MQLKLETLTSRKSNLKNKILRDDVYSESNICICTNKTCHNFKTVYNLWQQESETMKTENIINNPNNKL